MGFISGWRLATGNKARDYGINEKIIPGVAYLTLKNLIPQLRSKNKLFTGEIIYSIKFLENQDATCYNSAYVFRC